MKKRINGSIRPRPNAEDVQYYDITLELGTDPATGKRKRMYFKVNTTDREEAENELMIKKAEYLQEKLLEPSKETVTEFMERFLEDTRRNLSPATTRDYRQTIERYIEPLFGHMKIQELTRAKVQQVYNSLRKKSNRSDNPLSASTIKHIHRVLKCALNVAVDEGIIKENPVRKIKIGKDICSDHLEVYTVEEIRALEKAVRGTDMELPVALLFDCVMRRGELLGLSYSDIDFDKKEVTIQHAWTETETNEPVLKDCKTESSYRKLIVSDLAIARALAAEPAIILADEPTGNLDGRTSQDVLGLLKVTSQKFSQTIVMITHNEEIAQLADRIIRIEDGHIQERAV